MTRILVFGGSFDPPHLGHAALLSAAARAVRPDRILVVPAYQAPLKGVPRAEAGDRLAMLRLAFGKKACVELSEMRSRRRVYSVETLARLRRAHPKAELHFVVGSDSAAAFRRWKQPARLRALSRWWTARRAGSALAIPGFFKRVPGKMPDISSSALRRRLALGESAAGMLTPAVESYIRRKRLYGTGLIRRLKAGLRPERFSHTLAVAKLAEELARRWGSDPSRARLAGLLHDFGRSIAVPRMPAYARRRRLSVPGLDDVIRRQPLLLHAYISADLAGRRLGVRDAGVLSAVRAHTLGAPRMSLLDRILYVADACSEDRGHAQAAPLRRLAFKDLDEAFRGCVLNKFQHALSFGSWIHPLTLSLWNSLQG